VVKLRGDTPVLLDPRRSLALAFFDNRRPTVTAPFSRTTRSLAQHSPRGAIAIWLGVALLLAMWAAWLFLDRVNLVEVSHQARLEVGQSTRPISAALAGRVLRSHLRLGQAVQEGDVLVELDASAPKLRWAEEQVRQKGLAGQVAALKLEINAQTQAAEHGQHTALAAVQGAQFRTQEAQAALAFAGDQARRLAEESQAGGVAQIDALQAAAEARKLSASRDALAADARRLDADGRTRSAQARVQLETLHRQLAAFNAELQNGQAQMASLRRDIDQHQLRAPVSGRIGDMAPLRVGDVVAVGQKFANVVPPGELIVVADFEPVLGRVRAGQPALLRLDGFPWAQHGSLVATVSRVAGEIRDGRVRVEFTPHTPTPKGMVLQHGLPGSIEVSLEQVSPAQLLLRASGQWLAGGAVRTAAQTAAPSTATSTTPTAAATANPMP
jgi:membrane fusion protein, adhesin transport system